MDLEQWAVGGTRLRLDPRLPTAARRQKIYTTFTFLGASGFSYGLGAPVYYILATTARSRM